MTSLDNERRVALVFGNANYKFGNRLKNPHNDARSMAAMLNRLGFKLHLPTADDTEGWWCDSGVEEMRLALSTFMHEAKSADAAAIYFGGHGMDFDGENYLMPVSVQLTDTDQLDFQAISLGTVMRSLRAVKGFSLVVLDCCRVSEFEQLVRGFSDTREFHRKPLAEPKIRETRIAVAYATNRGAPAYDGPENGNSPFVEAMLQCLEVPDEEIRHAFGAVHEHVVATTRRRGVPQYPHLYESLGGKKFYLKRTAVGAAGGPHLWAEKEWSLLKDSSDIELLRAFEREAPEYYKILTRRRLDHIRGLAWVETSTNNSRQSLESFIEQWPDTEETVLAKALLDDIESQVQAKARRKADWETATHTDSRASYEAFLSTWKDGEYVEQAVAERDSLIWWELLPSTTSPLRIIAISEYMRKRPRPSRVTELARLELEGYNRRESERQKNLIVSRIDQGVERIKNPALAPKSDERSRSVGSYHSSGVHYAEPDPAGPWPSHVLDMWLMESYDRPAPSEIAGQFVTSSDHFSWEDSSHRRRTPLGSAIAVSAKAAAKTGKDAATSDRFVTSSDHFRWEDDGGR